MARIDSIKFKLDGLGRELAVRCGRRYETYPIEFKNPDIVLTDLLYFPTILECQSFGGGVDRSSCRLLVVYRYS